MDALQPRILSGNFKLSGTHNISRSIKILDLGEVEVGHPRTRWLYISSDMQTHSDDSLQLYFLPHTKAPPYLNTKILTTPQAPKTALRSTCVCHRTSIARAGRGKPRLTGDVPYSARRIRRDVVPSVGGYKALSPSATCQRKGLTELLTPVRWCIQRRPPA